jgi:hypothetical protein
MISVYMNIDGYKFCSLVSDVAEILRHAYKSVTLVIGTKLCHDVECC